MARALSQSPPAQKASAAAACPQPTAEHGGRGSAPTWPSGRPTSAWRGCCATELAPQRQRRRRRRRRKRGWREKRQEGRGRGRRCGCASACGLICSCARRRVHAVAASVRGDCGCAGKMNTGENLTSAPRAVDHQAHCALRAPYANPHPVSAFFPHTHNVKSPRLLLLRTINATGREEGRARGGRFHFLFLRMVAAAELTPPTPAGVRTCRTPCSLPPSLTKRAARSARRRRRGGQGWERTVIGPSCCSFSFSAAARPLFLHAAPSDAAHALDSALRVALHHHFAATAPLCAMALPLPKRGPTRPGL